MQKADSDIQQINSLLKAQKDQTVERVQAAVEHTSALQKQIEQLNQKLANFQATELLSQVQTVAGRSTLITTVQKHGCEITSQPTRQCEIKIRGCCDCIGRCRR